MKILTKEEFDAAVKHAHKMMEVKAKNQFHQRQAKAIFHNLTDRNITLSYMLYMEALMDEYERKTVQALLGHKPSANEVDFFLDALGKARPKCPQCGMELRIGLLNNHPSSMVGGDYKTYWYCIQNNPKMCVDEIPRCDYVGDFSKLHPLQLAAEVTGEIAEAITKKTGGCGGCNK
jgi:hypothetical protein